MQIRTLLLLCALVTGGAVASHAQEPEIPTLTGYVTRAASGSDFDVNGIRVLCSGVKAGSVVSIRGINESAVGCPGDPPFIGESLIVYGVLNSKATSINADTIIPKPVQSGSLSGSALIDAMPEQESARASAQAILVRADGYLIRITARTKIELDAPVQSVADVKAGNWIKYKGKQDGAGVLVADSVSIGPNVVVDAEEKLRDKRDYDPSAVPTTAKQNYLQDALTGSFDPKRVPPFKDNAMRGRIEKMGNSLVPAFQLALPDSDPAKINFRFQLIDTKLFRDALTLPSGIILIPHQVVERMQNDSQLATVLADAIAGALEKQEFRTATKRRIANAATWAGVFVPYTPGLSAGGIAAESQIMTNALKQSGRVSLGLLQDAGYDIDQAPLAWWLLSSRKPEPIAKIVMPYRSEYLYRILGETWHNPAKMALKAQQ